MSVRWTLLALLGTVLAVIGVAGLGFELAHGNDIWRRGSDFGSVALGGYLVWRGLSERASGTRSRPSWPTVVLVGALVGIAAILFAVSPPAAVLYLIVVLPFSWAAMALGWVKGE